MKCRYCSVLLAPLRSLTDGEFCCDDHREAFRNLDQEIVRLSSLPRADSLVRLHVALSGAAADIPAASSSLSEAQDFHTKVSRGLTSNVQTTSGWHGAATVAAITPSKFPGRTIFPRNTARPESMPVIIDERQAAPDWAANAQPEVRYDPTRTLDVAASSDGEEGSLHPSAEVPKSWRWLGDVWKKAPSDLKFITVLLPILLAVAIGPSVPKIGIARVNPGGVQQMVSGQWKDLSRTIVNRAAVAFTDDFRS